MKLENKNLRLSLQWIVGLVLTLALLYWMGTEKIIFYAFIFVFFLLCAIALFLAYCVFVTFFWIFNDQTWEETFNFHKTL